MFLLQLLTCFEDLIAERETGPLVGVVWHESDLQRGPGWNDGRRGDIAAVSTQNVGGVRGPVADLDEVVPAAQQKHRRYYPRSENVFRQWSFY